MPPVSTAGGSSSSSSRVGSRVWGRSRALHGPTLVQQRSFASKSSAHGSSSGSSSSSSSSNADPSGSDEDEDAGPATLAAALAALAQQCGCSDIGALTKAAEKLGKKRQAWFAEHSADVATWLHRHGVSQAQLGLLLLRCPPLFTWPVEHRALVLFSQLQRLGLTVAEAARCFEQQPVAAGKPTFQPAIAVLAQLFAAGSKSSAPAEQLVGSFLRGQPAAVKLLATDAQTLQLRINDRLGWGLTRMQLVAALQQSRGMLDASPAHVAALAAVLQQKLGGGRKLFAEVLHRAPRVASCGQDTVRDRAQALVEAFGQEAALEIVESAPNVLGINSSVWQTNVEVMVICGVLRTSALAVARATRDALRKNLLSTDKLANLLVMQRCLPGGLTAGQVYEQHASYIVGYTAKRVAGRLLFIQHHSLQPLLVEKKRPARQQWRRQHGLPAGRPAPAEPQFISLCDVCTLPDAKFASLPAVQAAGGLPALRAFMAGLEANAGYRALQAEAEADGAHLQAQLPDDLQQAAKKRQQTAEEKSEEEE